MNNTERKNYLTTRLIELALISEIRPLDCIERSEEKRLHKEFERDMETYALYRGDEFLTLGSKKELAEYLGCKEDTINFYLTKTYQKRCKGHYGRRLIVIRIED